VRVTSKSCTNREAAARIVPVPDTINTYQRHGFTKLGIRSRVELTRLALRHQWHP
jgi:DNA-binding CsgD family transcriptional regulator